MQLTSRLLVAAKLISGYTVRLEECDAGRSESILPIIQVILMAWYSGQGLLTCGNLLAQ